MRQLVTERGSTRTDLHGIGPAGAARLLADVGDIHRFRDRDRFVSWNGTAPLDASSGQQQRHRLSRAGNRKINRVLHTMAIVQLRRPSAGRTYYDRRRAAGKTSMEAMRALKRRLSNVVYARILADQQQREKASPGGQSGATLDSSATGSTPHTGSSEKPQPGLTINQTSPALQTAPRHERGANIVRWRRGRHDLVWAGGSAPVWASRAGVVHLSGSPCSVAGGFDSG
ncbi:transposase [Nocardia sp. NPDC059246]|uniref:transposase n=2 Tax=unclassified Nocardia TaxID=2637762 RepID=UPI003697F209